LPGQITRGAVEKAAWTSLRKLLFGQMVKTLFCGSRKIYLLGIKNDEMVKERIAEITFRKLLSCPEGERIITIAFVDFDI